MTVHDIKDALKKKKRKGSGGGKDGGGGDEDFDATVRRLALLPPLLYEKARMAEANRENARRHLPMVPKSNSPAFRTDQQVLAKGKCPQIRQESSRLRVLSVVEPVRDNS